MTTVAQAVEASFAKLYTSRRPTLNQLAADINDSTVTIPLVRDVVGLAGGVRVSVDLEDCHVWDVNATALTVRRGHNGSTPAAHGSGAVVYINPEFSPYGVFAAMNETLLALPGSGVVQYKTVDLTSDPTKGGYDLTSVGDLLRVHRVSWRMLGPRSEWSPLPANVWRVEQKSLASEFPSGEGFFLNVDIDPGVDVRVLYQAPFSPLTSLTDDVEAVSGLPASAHNLLHVGAMYRLLLGRPVARSSPDGQGDTRRPGEVSVNDSRSGAVGIQQEWLQAVRAARMDQLRKYGL